MWKSSGLAYWERRQQCERIHAGEMYALNAGDIAFLISLIGAGYVKTIYRGYPISDPIIAALVARGYIEHTPQWIEQCHLEMLNIPVADLKRGASYDIQADQWRFTEAGINMLKTQLPNAWAAMNPPGFEPDDEPTTEPDLDTQEWQDFYERAEAQRRRDLEAWLRADLSEHYPAGDEFPPEDREE